MSVCAHINTQLKLVPTKAWLRSPLPNVEKSAMHAMQLDDNNLGFVLVATDADYIQVLIVTFRVIPQLTQLIWFGS